MAASKRTKQTIQITGSDGPTLRGVEILLRELERACYPKDTPEETELENKRAELRAAFESSPAYKAVQKRLQKIEEAKSSIHQTRRTAVGRVRQRYFAYGLTPKIAAEIQALVDLFHKEM